MKYYDKLEVYKIVLIVLLGILLSPVIVLISIIYGIYYICCYIRDSKKYHESFYYRQYKKIYKPSIMKNDNFLLMEELANRGIYLEWKIINGTIFLVEQDNVFLLSDSIYYYSIDKNGNLLISDDGAPYEEATEFFNKKFKNEKNIKLLIFDEYLRDLNMNCIEDISLFSNFQNIIIGKSIEDFANEIIKLKK